MNKNIITNEKGQALVFVVATMTVALAVGVGVSLRNLSSISRTSRTDTASRAQAAAEGGAENILSRPDSELEGLIGGDPVTITYTPTEPDTVYAEAVVTVAAHNIVGQDYLPMQIQKGQVAEVTLDGGSVKVCWSPVVSETSTDLHFTAYNDSGDFEKDGVAASGRDGFPGSFDSNFDGSSAGEDGFNDCYTPNLPSSVKGLRIRSVNGASNIGVYPTSGSLPNQGFRITSIGKLRNVEQGEEAEASVVVVRSYSYASGIFDFGVFSGSAGDTLN